MVGEYILGHVSIKNIKIKGIESPYHVGDYAQR